MKNIVVIGGGTGSFVVLSGLKKIKNVNLTAIVPSTDDGGSTGRLKDEFGQLPVGDVRQCLVALAENEEEQYLLRQLFNYRFDKGESGLKGHNFGNLLLTALTEIYENELSAIKKAQKLLNIQGNVYPATLQHCKLIAEYENGEILEGEHNIDEPGYPHDGRLRISKLYTDKSVKTYNRVQEAIDSADLVILGPGDLYTSVCANLVVRGIPKALKKSSAKKMYISNLMTKFGQTFGYNLSDHVHEIENYSQTKMDYVLHNDNNLPNDILKRYELQNDYPVENDMEDETRVITTNLLASEEVVTPQGDVLQRSLIRHDPDRIAEEVEKVIGSKI